MAANLSIIVNADTREARDRLRELAQELKTLQRAAQDIRAASTQMRASEQSASRSQATQGMRAQGRAFREETARMRIEMRKAMDELGNSRARIAELAKRQGEAMAKADELMLRSAKEGNRSLGQAMAERARLFQQYARQLGQLGAARGQHIKQDALAAVPKDFGKNIRDGGKALDDVGRRKDKLRDNFRSFGEYIRWLFMSRLSNVLRQFGNRSLGRSMSELMAPFYGFGRVVAGMVAPLNAFKRFFLGFLAGLAGPFTSLLSTIALAWRVSLVAMGAALGLFLRNSVQEWLLFEKRITQIIVQMPGTARDAFGRFAELAFELSREVGKSATQITESLRLAVSVGFESMDQAAEVARASSKLAVASFTDIQTSTEALTNLLNSYGLEARDASAVTDRLMRGWQVAGGEMGDFSHGLGVIASSAQATGTSMEDLIAFTALLSRSAAGNRRIFLEANQAFEQLIAPTGEAGNAMRALGVQFVRNSEGGMDFLNTLLAIQARLRQLGGRDQQQIFRLLRDLFPDQRARRALARFFSAAPESIREVFAAVRNSHGAVDQALTEVNRRQFRSWEELGATIERVMISLGMVIGNTLAPAVRHFENFLRQFEVGKPMFEALRDEFEIFAGEAIVVAANIIDFFKELDFIVRGLAGSFRLIGSVMGGVNNFPFSATAAGAAGGAFFGGPVGAFVGGAAGFAVDAYRGYHDKDSAWSRAMRGVAEAPPGSMPIGFQRGGIVPGSGRGDRVPALLEPGELVVPRSVVERVARGPGMQEGGRVPFFDTDAMREFGHGFAGRARARRASRIERLVPELERLERAMAELRKAIVRPTKEMVDFAQAMRSFRSATTDQSRRFYGERALGIGQEYTQRVGPAPETAREIVERVQSFSPAQRRQMTPDERIQFRQALQDVRIERMNEIRQRQGLPPIHEIGRGGAPTTVRVPIDVGPDGQPGEGVVTMAAHRRQQRLDIAHRAHFRRVQERRGLQAMGLPARGFNPRGTTRYRDPTTGEWVTHQSTPDRFPFRPMEGTGTVTFGGRTERVYAGVNAARSHRARAAEREQTISQAREAMAAQRERVRSEMQSLAEAGRARRERAVVDQIQARAAGDRTKPAPALGDPGPIRGGGPLPAGQPGLGRGLAMPALGGPMSAFAPPNFQLPGTGRRKETIFGPPASARSGGRPAGASTSVFGAPARAGQPNFGREPMIPATGQYIPAPGMTHHDIAQRVVTEKQVIGAEGEAMSLRMTEQVLRKAQQSTNDERMINMLQEVLNNMDRREKAVQERLRTLEEGVR